MIIVTHTTSKQQQLCNELTLQVTVPPEWIDAIFPKAQSHWLGQNGVMGPLQLQKGLSR